MSAQIDYTTIAVIAAASGFFGAFGTELAKALIIYAKTRNKNVLKQLKKHLEQKN
jgi:hypothetical protein